MANLYPTESLKLWKKAKELREQYYMNYARAKEKGGIRWSGSAWALDAVPAGLGDDVYSLTGEPQEQPGSAARGALETILTNISISRQNSTPICQDTGTPIFYVKHPEGWSTRKLCQQIEAATVEATQRAFLRPNSVDSLSGKNSGNNLGGDHFPSVHFEEVEGDTLTIDLMLKGGGCENVGAQYSLPNSALGAGRDLAGVRKVVLDAVHQAQGQGCAPGILGVAIGGDRGSGYLASKEARFQKMADANPNLSWLRWKSA